MHHLLCDSEIIFLLSYRYLLSVLTYLYENKQHISHVHYSYNFIKQYFPASTHNNEKTNQISAYIAKPQNGERRQEKEPATGQN